MFNALVLYPVIKTTLDKEVIENKLLETCNLVKAINLKLVHQEYFYLKKPEPGNLLRSGKIDYFKECWA